MGEYIHYKNQEIKIGTCENLYYATYQKYKMALERSQLSIFPGSGKRKTM